MNLPKTNWKPITIQRLTGTTHPDSIPALGQIITERWNRIIRAPYMVYLPEQDRLLILASCDFPLRPMILSSDDHGATWTEPKVTHPFSADARHQVGVGLTYLGGGKLVFCTEEEGRFFSDDYGLTWSDPIPKPPTTGGKPWYQWDPMWIDRDPHTGKVDRVGETGWNFISEAWLPDGTMGPNQAYLRYSLDEGKTWQPDLEVPEWRGACEVALIRAANGDLVAACRTDPPNEYKRPVPEADHYSGLGVSVSRDNGRTWSKINLLFAWGRHHPSMVLLPDGRILMTYVVRLGYEPTSDGFPQFGIEAVVSRDHGQTWDLDHRCILAQWKGNQPPERAWWPAPQATSSLRLPDGSILTAYGTCYRGQPGQNNTPIPADLGLIQWREENFT